MWTYHTDSYVIDVYEDNTYTSNSTDNTYKYSYEYFGGDSVTFDLGYGTRYGVRVSENDKLIKSAILLSSGGATSPDSNSVVLENDRILVIVGKTVFCLGLPNLNLLWQTEGDEVTCFEIIKIGSSYIIHGELAITSVNVNGDIEWSYTGRDIFVTSDGKDSFKIENNIIVAKDFQGYVYRIGLDGSTIK